jgi:hypothetical protein
VAEKRRAKNLQQHATQNRADFVDLGVCLLAISGFGPDLDIANTPEGPRGLPDLGHLWESRTALGLGFKGLGIGNQGYVNGV